MSERNSRIRRFRSAGMNQRNILFNTKDDFRTARREATRKKNAFIRKCISFVVTNQFSKGPPAYDIEHTQHTRDKTMAMQSIGEQKNPSFPIELVTTAHGAPAAEICILSRCSKVNTRNQPLAGHRVFAWSTAMSLTYFPSTATDLFINLYFNYIRFY